MGSSEEVNSCAGKDENICGDRTPSDCIKPASPGKDSLNNVEQVVVTNPKEGLYHISFI